MKRGYLTVYLSLILAVLVGFVLTLVEGARTNAIRMKAVCAADVGINSTLAEYNRELLKQYDLLFIDMTYGSNGGNIGTVNAHLTDYLKKNLDDSTPALSRDLLGMRLKSAVIEEYALATDNDAEAVQRQVADYMNTTLKGIAMSGFDDLTSELRGSGYDYDVEKKREETQAAIDSIGVPTLENEEGEMVEVPISNPADAASSARRGGILGLVIKDTSSISKTSTDTSQYVSNRRIYQGNGISDEERSVGRRAGQLIYDEYLFDKCGYYLNPKAEGLLSYQIEYIIKNKDSDWDNLESVCRTLMFWREGINFTFLMMDGGRKEEAGAVAAALAAVIMNPELEEPITISILLAWAFVESLQDLRILMEGDGVPVIKTASNWHTGLWDILHPRSALKSYPGQEGAKYGDYLKTMLLMTSYSKVIAKSMDVMEMDIRKTPGNSGFKMDYCMQSFLVHIVAEGFGGQSVEIRRRSGYYYA